MPSIHQKINLIIPPVTARPGPQPCTSQRGGNLSDYQREKGAER